MYCWLGMIELQHIYIFIYKLDAWEQSSYFLYQVALQNEFTFHGTFIKGSAILPLICRNPIFLNHPNCPPLLSLHHSLTPGWRPQPGPGPSQLAACMQMHPYGRGVETGQTPCGLNLTPSSRSDGRVGGGDGECDWTLTSRPTIGSKGWSRWWVSAGQNGTRNWE